MNLIAAVDKNWAIGLNNKLLVSIPDDMKFFKKMTTGGVVIMGRRTLESFPKGMPLKDRVNIVLTKNEDFDAKGAVKVSSKEALYEVLKDYSDKDIFVIGGESIYRQLSDECDTAYITRIDHEFEADAWFPDLDRDPSWELCDAKDYEKYGDITYRFTTYKRSNTETLA